MKRGPSKSGSSPDLKSLKKSEDSRVQNHSSDSEFEVLEDPGELQNPDVPVNVESADNSRKVENSDAPENVEKPVIPKNEENPAIPENVENLDMPGNVENQDMNENVENQDIHQNVENQDMNENVENQDIHQNVENQDIHQNVENQDIHQNVENQNIYQIVESSEDSGNSSIGDPERLVVVINAVGESEESSSSRESDASVQSSEGDASAESSEGDASAESSERDASAEPSERDASAEPSERDASAEPSERDASAELSERDASAEPSERDASAESSERDASAEPSERDASAESSDRDASAEPSERDASVEPSERDASAEPSERNASAVPFENEAPSNRLQLSDIGDDSAAAARAPRCDPDVCSDCLNNIEYYQQGVRRATAIDKAERLKVLCVGQCCVDLVKTCENFPTEHSINSCINFRYQRGGSASNVCTVLRIMNQPTEYFGVLSNGPFSGFLEDDLRECYIDFSHCQKREDILENPTSVVILSRATQSQTIIHYNQNYPEETDRNFYNICLCKQTWVHFEGRNVQETLKMMNTINRHNERISVINKVAHQTGLLHVPINISVELKHARVGVMNLVAYAHVVFVTEQFARTQRLESIGDTIRYIRQYAMQNAVILSYWGERGAMGFSATDEIVQSPSFINPNWVDPLGSQDVFTAAVIHFLNQEKISGLRDAPDEEPEPIQQKVQHLHSCFDRETVQRACTFGCQCAGVKVGFEGYEGLRTRYGAYLDE